MMNTTLINDAIQQKSQKPKIKAIQKKFKCRFGEKLFSKAFDYEISLADLNDMFDLLNNTVFNNKIDKTNLDISIVQQPTFNSKGRFRIGQEKDKWRAKIDIVKYDKDNFFQIVNVLLHEMIHAYDSQHGELKKKISNFYVDRVNGKEYVDGYDSHGKYFQNWCNRLNSLGFDVHITYSINSRRQMKKLIEKSKDHDNFFDSSTSKDDQKYKRLKEFYKKLKNEGKALVYRDAEHWYIQIT